MGEHDDELVRAVLLWTGRGVRSWPSRDDGAVLAGLGESRGRELLAAVKALEVDFYASDAHLTHAGLEAITDRAAEEFRQRHPGVPDAIVDALAWCYSYDWK